MIDLLADRRGASVIELALIAPVLCIMLAGVIDLSMGLSSRLSLEQGAYRALERVSVANSAVDFAYLRAEAAEAAGVPEGQVRVENWLECNRVRQGNYDSTCPSGQMTSRYVEITINSTFSPSFPWGPLGRSFGMAPNGRIPVTAVAAVRLR